MQRHRKLDHTKARAQMAAGDGNRVDHLLAEFIGELPQLAGLEPAKVFRHTDAVE